MIDITTAKPLQIVNENNKLLQETFIQIHFAPPRASFRTDGIYRGTFIEADFNQVFVITDAGKQYFVKLADFTRLKFADILNSYTQKSSGIDAYSWKVDFMNRFPKTTNETEMAIYEYERIKQYL